MGWPSSIRARRGAVLAAIGACAVATIVLRVALDREPPLGIDPSLIVEREGGIELRANASARSHTREWDTRVATNRFGMRDLDRAASPSAFRILAVGDEFGFGAGVAMESGALARAEDYLDREAKREVQIIKATMPGWSPHDARGWLERHAAEWSPHLVLLLFAADTDWAAAGVAETKDAISARANARRRGEIFRREPAPASAAAIAATEAALDAAHAVASRAGAAFAVAVIPAAVQIQAEDYALFKKRGALEDGDLDMGRPQREIEAWAKRRGVPVIDLEPPLSAFAARAQRRLYFQDASVWTEEGHKIGGNTMARFLLDGGLVPRGDDPALAAGAAGATGTAQAGRERLSLPRRAR